MGNGEKLSDVQTLLKDRGDRYGDSDILTGILLNETFSFMVIGMPPLTRMVVFYHWMQILSKLCRLVWSPNDMDTWQDIAGYTQLALNHLKEQEEPESQKVYAGPVLHT